ncbi:MAG: tellurite resistance TerB C-terminal domain-containing protein, partial [Oscillospiraceae bacterium]
NTLLDFENQTKEEIFNEIVSISSYKVENSKCYKTYNKEFIDITYGVISCLIENQGKENFQRQFLGRFVKSKYTIFNSAVFYQKEDIGNYCFKFNEGLIYLVDNQNWTIKRFLFDNNKIKGIGDLLKTIDFIMREKYKIKSTLKVPEISNEIKNIILNEIDKIQNPKIEINIDITKLDDIRASAIKTQKKLIVDENEIDSFFNREKIQCDDNKAVLNNTDKKQECSNECILSDIEKQFLNLILTNTSLNDFLKENRLMESVVVDQIHEKL